MIKMIYLHHTPLIFILPNYQGRLNSNDRECIRAYRHRLLSQFCQTHHLPTPIYDKDKYGKPFCQNVANLSFNHSHCASDYALIYGFDIKNIGVDIENIHRKLNFYDLAKRYFHADEYVLWQHEDCDECLWFKLWTIKEAVLKASGIGIRLPLNEIKAVFMDDDTGYVYHQDMGKFYFKNKMINDCVITVAYPFEYRKIIVSFS